MKHFHLVAAVGILRTAEVICNVE